MSNRKRQALMEQRAVLENAILARQLNNPLQDAQGLATLLAVQSEEARLNEGRRQFDESLGLDRTKIAEGTRQFDRKLGLDALIAKTGANLQARDLDSRDRYYSENNRNEGRKIDIMRFGADTERANAEAGRANADQMINMKRAEQAMGLFEAVRKATQSDGKTPLVSDQDSNELLMNIFQNLGMNPYDLPSERNAELRTGLAEAVNKGTELTPEMAQIMKAMDMMLKQSQQPQQARPFEYADNLPYASY